MTITVKPGDDIAWIGEIKREGVTTFVGYTLTAQIRLKNAVSGAPDDLLADATIAWVDAALGLFSFSVPRSVTAEWPEGACLMVDIRIASPDNKWVRTDTSTFQTTAGVTE